MEHLKKKYIAIFLMKQMLTIIVNESIIFYFRNNDNSKIYGASFHSRLIEH